MDKLKKIAKEKSTWAVGVPSLIIGVGTLLKADYANEIAGAVQHAGNQYAVSGDWASALGWLVAGSVGIFMRGRGK